MISASPLPEIPAGFLRRAEIPADLMEFRDPMFDLIQGPCRTVVEIGSQWGWWAARAARQLPEATIWCVDPWCEPPPKKKIKVTGLDNFCEWTLNTEPYRWRINAVRDYSWNVAQKFKEPIDLLFIDGDHRVFAVLRDLEMWVPKVRPGGLIVGHDWNMLTVRKAVRKFWLDGKYKVADLYPKTPERLTPCFWRYAPC